VALIRGCVFFLDNFWKDGWMFVSGDLGIIGDFWGVVVCIYTHACKDIDCSPWIWISCSSDRSASTYIYTYIIYMFYIYIYILHISFVWSRMRFDEIVDR